MSETRNVILEQLSTEQLLRLKSDIKREVNLRIQRQHGFYSLPPVAIAPTANQKKLATELLAYVNKADYDSIESMWKRNPELMFVEVADKNGQLTTPLKRALYNLDTWAWKPFYEWIKQNKPDLLAEFIAQNEAQTSHVNMNYLQPLFDEYANLRDKAKLSFNKKISNADFDIELKKLFSKQNEILPWHMIREMCRKGDFWNQDSRFNAKDAPKGGHVYAELLYKDISLDSAEFDFYFGVSSGLKRDTSYHVSLCSNINLDIERAAIDAFAARYFDHDALIIAQLYKVRKADLADIPTLEQLAVKTASVLRK